MKIQIVYLTSTDDSDSTRDKIAWVKSPRVLLIWPDHGRVLAERLELVKIQRFAQRRNLQLGLLSFDSDVRHNAQELNIPIFDSLDELPEERWQDGHFQPIASSLETHERRINRAVPSGEGRTPAWTGALGKKRAGRSARLILILVLVVFLIAAPSANIVLSPTRKVHDTTLSFELDHNTLDIEGETSIHPELRDLVISGEASRPASGMSEVPTQYATGMVEFTNHSTTSIPIPSDTILHSEGPQAIRVKTLEPVLLTGGEGGTVEASVQAIQPGTDGNLKAFSITAIEGPLGLVVSVSNPRAMSGGADDLVPIITEEDHASLEEVLRAELIESVLAELSPVIESGHVVPEGGVWIAQVLEKDFDHEIGDLGNVLGLKMRVSTTALLYDQDSLEAFVKTEVGRASPLEEELIGGELNLETSVHIPASQEGHWQLEVHVVYQTYSKVDVPFLRSRIAGRRPQVVQQILHEVIPDLEFVTIENAPSWYPILPLWRDRIMIEMGWE